MNQNRFLVCYRPGNRKNHPWHKGCFAMRTGQIPSLAYIDPRARRECTLKCAVSFTSRCIFSAAFFPLPVIPLTAYFCILHPEGDRFLLTDSAKTPLLHIR